MAIPHTVEYVLQYARSHDAWIATAGIGRGTPTTGASPSALNCPLCGQPALWVLDGARLAFCGHDGCQLLT
jgi:hypothetical protein